MIQLALASLRSRRTTAILTIAVIAISVALLLAVERVRDQVQSHFANTVSGTDLIVGARTGDVQLLMASVFHIGAMTNNMSWKSYQDLSQRREVKWSIPVSLGDSVGGMPVVATTQAFFQHFHYGEHQSLNLRQGQVFTHVTGAVLGSNAAAKLDKKLGDALIVAHGSGGISFTEHGDHPFTVAGILAPTGTPVDEAIYIPLRGLKQIHGAHHEAEAEHQQHQDKLLSAFSGPPTESISAAFIGLKVKPLALRLQREINTQRGEPLTALLPGLTLQQLWKTLRLFEQALTIVSFMVVLTGLLGMLTSLLASLRERRREMAILRALGAGPGTVFGLLLAEAFLLTLVGTAAGVALIYLLQLSLNGVIQHYFGVILSIHWPSNAEWWRIAIVVVAGFVLSLLPAWRAYRQSLADGLTVKL